LVATLTPSFQEILPGWIARQPWYRGAGVPAIRAVGFFRLEDPAGEVGMETHLLTDGSEVYQVPMSYRGAPLDEPAGGTGAAALIMQAEHSELGTRWIYDAVGDPVWIAETIRMVAAEGAAATRSNPVVGPAAVRGVRYRDWPANLQPEIQLSRVLVASQPPAGSGVLGAVIGSWHAAGPDSPAVDGCLAVLRGPGAGA
jgi:hypothetical protein